MKKVALTLLVLAFADQALAAPNKHKADVSGSYYQDKLYSVTNANANYNFMTPNIFRKEGFETAVSMGVTNKMISLNADDERTLELLGGNQEITSLGGSFGIDQGLGVGTSVGAFVGMTESPVNDVIWYGARASQWLFHETLQVMVEYRHNEMDQQISDYTDVDGKRVTTPEQIAGENVNLQMTHFATTSTIMKYGFSLTQRSDRPNAWSAFAEARQYFDRPGGALHVNYSYYENVGQIQPVTSYGSVIANSVGAAWKQKIGKKTMLTGGYRFHYETEDPRAETSGLNHIGSDYYYSSLSYRLGRNAWTQSSSEISMLGGYYRSNEPVEGFILGLGMTCFL